jgi:hypothetical protein
VSAPPLRDFSLPAGLAPDAVASVPLAEGLEIESAAWSPSRLTAVADHLATRGVPALTSLGRERLLAAWARTVESFRDPRSEARRALTPALVETSGLSPAGLDAALEAVLWGVRAEAVAAAITQFDPRGGLALVILASNLPALAVQPMWRALASGQAVLVKSASAEPLFAPAFVTELARAEPALRDAVAAVTWPGGEAALEKPLLQRASNVVAFGGRDSIESLRARAHSAFTPHGPRLSVAVVGRGANLDRAAGGLARDIALFDQRGCLSPHAVFVESEGNALAGALANALERLASEWPPGPLPAAQLAAVQQLRAEAEMRGLSGPRLSIASGTVLIEPRPELRLSPGLRTVRVHDLPSLNELPGVLEPWRGRIQGVAVSGVVPAPVLAALSELGVTRIAPAGELQRPDAGWNGADYAPGFSA